MAIIIQQINEIEHKTQINCEIFNFLQEGILIINQNSEIKFWNNYLETLTGYLLDEVLNKKYNDNIVRHFNNNDEELLGESCPLNIVLNQGNNYSASLYMADKQGLYIPVQINVVPLFDVNGNLVGAAEIITRNSTIERVEKAYENLKEKLNDSKKIMNKLYLTSEKLNKTLEENVHNDILTGVFNRHFINNELENIVKEFQASGLNIAFLLIDIDNFSKINNRYGLLAGDEVIKKVAKLLTGSCRNTDIICRYTGNKFLVISPGSNTENTEILAEKIRKNIEVNKIRFQNRELITTVSIGYSLKESHIMTSLLEQINMAEEALLLAKKEGRNRSVMFRPQ
ncbi:MAG: sensor domain-containing diguanylate cyclase [Cyanobacteriota bacterium]